ncbi:MAG TPA: hypothetical protein VGE26_03395 [Sphingobacteriaceae bacterium]
MKISTLNVAASLLLFASLFTSCSETADVAPVQAEESTARLLSKNFSVQSVEENVDVSSKIYSAAGTSVSHENKAFDFTKATVISYHNSSYTVVAVPSSADSTKQVVYKAYKRNGRIEISGAFNLEVNVNKTGNGFVAYSDGSSAVRLDFANFKIAKTTIDAVSKTKASGNSTSAASICDKNSGESFSSCYSRQVDQICDGWLGCASLAFPATHTVIAASCSCIG